VADLTVNRPSNTEAFLRTVKSLSHGYCLPAAKHVIVKLNASWTSGM
jgi:hypothetical protein